MERASSPLGCRTEEVALRWPAALQHHCQPWFCPLKEPPCPRASPGTAAPRVVWEGPTSRLAASCAHSGARSPSPLQLVLPPGPPGP